MRVPARRHRPALLIFLLFLTPALLCAAPAHATGPCLTELASGRFLDLLRSAFSALWAGAGSSLDPSGAAVTGDHGSGLDPNGDQVTGDHGSGLDPDGHA
jgi:hypothetical protein